MANDKKDYQAVLVALGGTGTATSLVNKLVKVEVATEDPKLKKALGVLISRLKAGASLRLDDVKAVKKYCEIQTSSAKPQWQILAEQHGWMPPKA